jgi:succinate dehydrogenase / fumarate reductase flavoprotein subunit
MGGLWVDYNLMSNLPGLFVLGEANFSDHGANRLGASALMQGLADGFFIIPYTLGGYLASTGILAKKVDTSHPAVKQAEADVKEGISKLLAVNGKRSVDSFHRELGLSMWEKCGMARNDKGLRELLQKIPTLREEYWKNVVVTGSGEELNQNLERAGRVADYMEFAELLALDALERKESCGGHFREESQEEGEAKRDDENFAYAACWAYQGKNKAPKLIKEPLSYEVIKLSTRSYK